MININKVDCPVDPSKFKFIEKYPYCLLGFQIKNQYDQTRHKIPDKYQSVDLIHKSKSPTAPDLFFRGIQIKPSLKMTSLLNVLLKSNLDTQLKGMGIKRYSSLLKEYGLSCDTCLGKFEQGVYPIDGEYINKVAFNDIDLIKLYDDIFSDKDVPYFQSVGYIAIYVLTQREIFFSKSNNFIR